MTLKKENQRLMAHVILISIQTLKCHVHSTAMSFTWQSTSLGIRISKALFTRHGAVAMKMGCILPYGGIHMCWRWCFRQCAMLIGFCTHFSHGKNAVHVSGAIAVSCKRTLMNGKSCTPHTHNYYSLFLFSFSMVANGGATKRPFK